MAKSKANMPYAPLQNVAGLFALTNQSPSFEINQQDVGELSSSTLVVALDQIVVGNRIRQYLDAEKTESLAHSIRQHGFRGVLWVREIEGKYHLIAGGRRYAACQLAGVAEVPVEVWNISDAEAIQLELLENFQREDLSPIEEVEGVLRMLEMTLDLGRAEVVSLLGRMSRRDKDTGVLTPEETTEIELYRQVEQVFALIGKYSAESFRTHRLPLLNLPESLVEAINRGDLEYSKARVIARIKDEHQREELLEKVLAEGLSRVEVNDLVKQIQAEAQPAATPERAAYSKAQNITKRIRSAKLDGRKLKQVNKLLGQLEQLLSED